MEFKNPFQSTYDLPDLFRTTMDGARPIWDILGLTEEEYWIKYPADNEWTLKVREEATKKHIAPNIIDCGGNIAVENHIILDISTNNVSQDHIKQHVE